MRITLAVTLTVLVLASAIPSFAELQNVEVGGSIRIRGNYFSPSFTPPLFSNRGNSLSFIEQRTRLSVKADFTKDITAFIELDSYDIYGEDFRSSAITGIDTRAASFDDVEMYQAYIEIRETWGLPLTFRLGRQEILLGSEWLVGNKDTSWNFTGTSFDGIIAVYNHEKFFLAGGALKLLETSPLEEDGDGDLYGIYFGYTGIEGVRFDAYWLFADIGLSPGVVNPLLARSGITNFIGRLLGINPFSETTAFHTIGVRTAGAKANWDWEAEAAYQFGEASVVGDDAEYDAGAANLQVGYTFDAKTQPRLFLGAAFFSGADGRGGFFTRDADLGFNRLFSDWKYSQFIDANEMSNALILRGGIGVQPTENVAINFLASYFQVDEKSRRFFRSTESDDDLGTELELNITYNYSEDLTFSAGWAHLFVGDAIEDGSFISNNGLTLLGGLTFIGPFAPPARADDDIDFFWIETKIAF